MIACPKCQRALPDWAAQCQFCGSDTKGVARPVPVKKERRAMSTDAPTWVWGMYYAICIYYIASGGFSILSGIGAFNPKTASIVSVIVGGLNVIFGIGLAARIELIRGIANVFCFLNILGAVFGALGSFVLLPLMGGLAVISLIFNVVTFATSAFMIFLIGETDRAAPNI